MIEPKETDIGRAVVYTPAGYDGFCGLPNEEGVITSFNSSFVFVRYGPEKQSKATRRQDLEWSFSLVPSVGQMDKVYWSEGAGGIGKSPLSVNDPRCGKNQA